MDNMVPDEADLSNPQFLEFTQIQREKVRYSSAPAYFYRIPRFVAQSEGKMFFLPLIT